jgi:serine/threonine-protein kinase
MALTAGTRLGAYEITGQLGAGGMGEVYRAKDTKLGREVAIKTLPAALAGDKERLARFEREAKILAALNHAHIAAIYGLDSHEGTQFLAMELVDGETLEKRLKGGALPVEDALRLALQIAGALEAAHAKGVVHRDLKPANIMLTRDGQAKVLDFGLAKAFSGVAGEASPAHSPALSMAMTQQGLVLGTAGYMSPEQASGQSTDQRADVWAFGVVLYEMLTGLPVFKGESVPHILAAVLQLEPAWNPLPTNLHPRVRQVLERCLTKKPRSRLHSIADARIEIEAVLADPRGVTPEVAGDVTAPRSSNMLRVAATAVVAAAIAGAAGWLLRPMPAPEQKPVVRFSIPLAAEPSFPVNIVSMIAVSPDGQRIAYAADGAIQLRNLGDREAHPVPGTAETGGGLATPAFSPDGQWLAYVHVHSFIGPYTVKRIPISGGAPVPVHEAEAEAFPHGLSWATQDTILFTGPSGVVRIPANGGATDVLIARGQDERFFGPQLLPDGEAVLFTTVPGTPGESVGGLESAQVVVQSIGGDDRTVIVEGGSAARYLATGHVVYAQGTALFAIPFDPKARTVRGGSVKLVDGLRLSSTGLSDTAYFDVSETGTLVTVPASPATDRPVRATTLAWVDRTGREEPFAPARDYTMARISPDGTELALVIGSYLVTDTSAAIWRFDLRTESLSLLTADPGGDDGPVWSPDGTRIFFRSARGGSVGVYAIAPDTGETMLLAPSSPEFPVLLPWTISADGRTLGIITPTADLNIATLSLADGELSPLLNTAGMHENEPSFSPNGAWIADVEGRGGVAEINIRPFPGVSRTRHPVAPGTQPVFSRDGSELFFFDGQGISVVPITYEPTLSVGAPTRLFETAAYSLDAPGRAWDPDPSGQRFLMIRAPDPATSGARIDVVINWFEELKSRVPGESSGGSD